MEWVTASYILYYKPGLVTKIKGRKKKKAEKGELYLTVAL